MRLKTSSEPEIVKMLYASTQHFTEIDFFLMYKATPDDEYGMIVCCEDPHIENYNLGQAALQVVKLAHQHGCHWIRASPDVPVFENIPQVRDKNGNLL